MLSYGFIATNIAVKKTYSAGSNSYIYPAKLTNTTNLRVYFGANSTTTKEKVPAGFRWQVVEYN